MNAVAERSQSSRPGTEYTASSLAASPLRIRYRVRFEKVDLLRWIGHKDLARLWERIIRRAALVPSMTEGFHPKPRIGFPSALSLGIEGLDEVVELDLAENISPSDLLHRLENDRQPGLNIKCVSRLPEGFRKAQLIRSDFSITVPETADPTTMASAIEQLKSQEIVSIERNKKTIEANVREQIPVLECRESILWVSLAATDAASLKPQDILDLLGFSDWIEKGSLIVRERVILSNEFESDDPNEFAISAMQCRSSQPNTNPA